MTTIVNWNGTAWATPTGGGGTVDPPGPSSQILIGYAASITTAGTGYWEAVTTLEDEMATHLGVAKPLFDFHHGYSGNSFPSTFQTSSVKDNPGRGWPYSVLNVKTNWTSLANGSFDAHITNFIASIPTGHKVFLLINHEPENDSNASEYAIWCSGQARAANLIAALDDPRCEYAVCHMTFTWTPSSGRNPENWNPVTGGAIKMTPDALARAIFAPDGYTKLLNSAGTSVRTMASEFDAPFAAAAGWGFERFAISEHSLNNDVSAPLVKVIETWTGEHLPYIDAHNLVYYAGYNSEGPASGTNSRIDTPQERETIGRWILDHRNARD